MILPTNSPFLRTMRKTIDSDFSKHTGSDYYKCCQGKFVLEFTNEIPDDNEDTTEDDVRNIRGDIVIEKNPFSDFIDVKECQE